MQRKTQKLPVKATKPKKENCHASQAKMGTGTPQRFPSFPFRLHALPVPTFSPEKPQHIVTKEHIELHIVLLDAISPQKKRPETLKNIKKSEITMKKSEIIDQKTEIPSSFQMPIREATRF